MLISHFLPADNQPLPTLTHVTHDYSLRQLSNYRPLFIEFHTHQTRAHTHTESNTKGLLDYLPVYDNLRFSTLANGSLVINNVTQREQGYYVCSARNGFGPEMTKLIKITVHGKLTLSLSLSIRAHKMWADILVLVLFSMI